MTLAERQREEQKRDKRGGVEEKKVWVGKHKRCARAEWEVGFRGPRQRNDVDTVPKTGGEGYIPKLSNTLLKTLGGGIENKKQ